MPSPPTSFTIPGEVKPLHLLSQRSKPKKNLQAGSCYQKNDMTLEAKKEDIKKKKQV